MAFTVIVRGKGSRALNASIAALFLLALILAYQSWWRFNSHLDLAIYLEATRAFWNGENPYTIGTHAPFVYPPFLCVLLWPLAQLPLEVAATIWFIASVVALAIALRLVLNIDGAVAPRTAVVASAIVCVLLTEILQNNLRNAQINFLVLACTLAFAWSWSRGRKGLASSLLAAAIAVKITPGIFLIWLARRGDWRTLAATVVSVGVLTIAVPALVTGPRIVDDLRGYVETFIGGVTPGLGTTSERRPFSVVGTLRRFTDVSWPFDTVVLGLAVLLVTGLWFDRTSRGNGQIAANVSLYLVAILLVTPLSEVHHLACIVPGLVWLTCRGLAGQLTRSRIVALTFVLASLVLRRSFHGAAFVAVAGTWLLLAAECYSLARASSRSQEPGI